MADAEALDHGRREHARRERAPEDGLKLRVQAADAQPLKVDLLVLEQLRRRAAALPSYCQAPACACCSTVVFASASVLLPHACTGSEPTHKGNGKFNTNTKQRTESNHAVTVSAPGRQVAAGTRTRGRLEDKGGGGREHAARRAAAGALRARHQHARDRQQEVGSLVLEGQHLLLRHHLRGRIVLQQEAQCATRPVSLQDVGVSCDTSCCATHSIRSRMTGV